MRFLDIRGLPEEVIPTPSSDLARVFAENDLLPNWPSWQASISLIAVMLWPNDESKRDELLNAWTLLFGSSDDVPGVLDRDANLQFAGRTIRLREIGARTIRDLIPEIEAAQQSWINVGDLMLTLARLDANSPSDAIRGGPSIVKAKHIVADNPNAPNLDRLAADWSAYRNVAHLIAATCFLATLVAQDQPNRPLVPVDRAVFADPGTLLCIAARLQTFGIESHPVSRFEPFLSPKSTWRVPDNGQFPPEPIAFAPLSKRQVEVLGQLTEGRKHRSARSG